MSVQFNRMPDIRVVASSFEELPPYDAFVTAGNSYGIMTAGIDAAVVRAFGPSIIEAVQFRILNEFLGEQPVGSAFIVPTSDQRIPLLIHAPTMRMPHDISGTDAVYRATYAGFLAIYMHNTKVSGRFKR
jgi:O-acetyl-ADP-ribose deacetylase (regulator of RNase III)